MLYTSAHCGVYLSDDLTLSPPSEEKETEMNG